MKPYDPPKLKAHEGSWIIVNKDTGEGVIELFKDNKNIRSLNHEKYEAVPVSEYLSKLSNKG